ncbi:permease [Yersinia enterocolitica]|uniref:FtsX-like permease family protein n=1 Tax=Yersinia enterocolitica TaxID=630 RepID=UPI000327E143|nr:FtsX-like permease family protein [Yersinia enterocolitica]AOF17857.1 permease [Yersinia enterocolitica]AOF22390.1 permease [Yersinia enterocolitica]AOF26100.1 permease [Yersinia enterocolitica]AOF30211.1 permease [Yersinia enterocolitica]AOF34132.1 permease [Yersinia enterocolitica]
MGIYILEAIISLKENIRYTLTFIVFLSLSFLGVIITDSLIYSVSMQAEKELKSRGNNIISIELYQKGKKASIAKVLNDFYAKLSYSQRSFLSGGNSPYSDETISVMATDKAGINLIMGDEFDDSLFEGNVAIYNNNNQDISDKPRMIFFNGVPFHIIGVKNKSKAEFLDSLGLSPNNSNEKYYIPLDTLFRFNLDNKIDNVQIIFDKDITDEMSTAVKNKLKRNNIDKYMITTSLDARMIVERVLNRFSLLTNSIYLLLTITAIISCVVVCKRNFQSRSTEFALKIIHGISYKDIQIVVVIETIFTVIVSLLLSIVISILAIISLSSMLHIAVKIRWLMILISLSTVLMLCFIVNLFYGNKTFKINPVDLIKARTK